MAVKMEVTNVWTGVLVGAIAIILYFLTRRPRGLPPFPVTPLPIVGNLLSVEKDPRALFTEWRKKYGDIFSLYMGSKLMIVLNGHEIVREALVKNANFFSDRPDLLLFTRILHGRGIASSSGSLTKSQRKFALVALRDFGFGKRTLESDILEETKQLFQYCEEMAGSSVDLGRLFNVATSNILCSMVFGKRYDYKDPNFLEVCKALDNLLSNVPFNALFNYLPFLQWLPGDVAGIGAAMKHVECFENFLIKPEIERHMKEFDGTVKDFISAYIKEIKDRQEAGEDTKIFQDNFQQTVSDLFIGGTETTATTLKWLIVFLIHNPEVQERCFQEIRDNVGIDRLPTLTDKPSLPYVEATLAEIQRRANIAPFGVLHGVSDDTTFHGFNFPKGSVIMTNLDSVHMDPNVWPNPLEFRPSRFLDSEGKFFKPDALLPFSIGRRVCLGEAVAKMELYLLGAMLFQRFQFRQADGEPLPSLCPLLALSSTPQPFKVKIVDRCK